MNCPSCGGELSLDDIYYPGTEPRRPRYQDTYPFALVVCRACQEWFRVDQRPGRDEPTVGAKAGTPFPHSPDGLPRDN